MLGHIPALARSAQTAYGGPECTTTGTEQAELRRQAELSTT
ncbi:MAG: hypothetical protein U0074_01165 [Kouleothrix sp.]